MSVWLRAPVPGGVRTVIVTGEGVEDATLRVGTLVIGAVCCWVMACTRPGVFRRDVPRLAILLEPVNKLFPLTSSDVF